MLCLLANLEEILLGLDFANQATQVVPTLLVEGGADYLDNLTCGKSSDGATLAQ